MRLFLCAISVAISFAATSAIGQDAKKAEDVVIDPQIVQLNEMAARGEEQLADALNSFARLKRWADADRWLTRGVAPINDQDKLADMARRIGTDNLFKLSMEPSISPAGKSAVQKVAKAFQAHAQSKDRLLAAIDGLDDSSVDNRLESARRLMAGGSASLEALVAACVMDQPTAPRDDILRAMLRIGGGAENALGQLAIYGKAPARAHALKAYTRVDRKAALSDLLTALYAADTTDTESQFAKTNLPAVVGGIPSRPETLQYLYSELQRLRNQAAATENDIKRNRIWTVNDDRISVSPSYAFAIQKTYRDAYDAGARLRRIGGLSAEMTDAVLASDLAYRVMIDPDWGLPKQLQAFRSTYAGVADATALANAISNALDSKTYPTLVGLLRLIDDSMTQDRELLLQGSSPRPTPLVRAAMDSEPRVRYEAAVAIARLNPPASYPGSSQVRRCYAEMSRLTNRPMAILLETRADVALHQESILSQLGFDTTVVGTARGMERCISQGGDLRIIVSKTQLWDVAPVEMIDRVRRLKLGKNVPIMFYGDEAAGIDTDRWTGVSNLIERPRSPAAFGNLLIDQELAYRLPQLTELDRNRFRRQAKELLSKN